MNANIVSTSKIVTLNDVPARIWTGHTDSGIEVIFYVTRVAISSSETRVKEFKNELKSQIPPTPAIAAIPLRLIL